MQGENKGLAAGPPASRAALVAAPHYLVIDTNVVLDQIDLLEAEGLEHVIILTTVLEEVRHRSSPIYKRLRDLVANTRRDFYVFVNEHRRETWVERRAGESANDRSHQNPAHPGACSLLLQCLWQTHCFIIQTLLKAIIGIIPPNGFLCA